MDGQFALLVGFPLLGGVLFGKGHLHGLFARCKVNVQVLVGDGITQALEQEHLAEMVCYARRWANLLPTPAHDKLPQKGNH